MLGVLQVLQLASQHCKLQPKEIEPVLLLSLQFDATRSPWHMGAESHEMLTLLKHAASQPSWQVCLQPATAMLMAEALLQEPGQPGVAELYQLRRSAVQVSCSLAVLHPSHDCHQLFKRVCQGGM